MVPVFTDPLKLDGWGGAVNGVPEIIISSRPICLQPASYMLNIVSLADDFPANGPEGLQGCLTTICNPAGALKRYEQLFVGLAKAGKRSWAFTARSPS